MSQNIPHFLVTAGNTHEKIDDVRAWSNIFTGRTGLDIALALLAVGNVTLMTSNLEHAREFDGYSGDNGMLGIETFRSHADLLDLLMERVPGQAIDGIFMSAAVSDYKPAGVYQVLKREMDPAGQERWIVERVKAAKFPSDMSQMAVLGEPTEKIVDLFRTKMEFKGLLVKFKLQAGISEEQLLAIAAKSRRASDANFIVANTLEMVQGTAPAAWIVSETSQERIARKELAAHLCKLTKNYLNIP